MGDKTNWIRLTQGKFTEVDTVDLVWLSKYKWYAKRTTGKKHEYGTYYAARSKKVNGQSVTIYMHRDIMGCPYDREVDHKNGKSLCNKRDNLRVCTRSQNNRYRDARNSGG